MTKNTQEKESSSNFNTLTNYFQHPLFDLREAINKIGSTDVDKTVFGIVAPVATHSNVLHKTASLFRVSMNIWLLKIKLKRRGYQVTGKYGVYPDLEAPLIIFELDSKAADYTNNLILPTIPSGINGALRKVIMGITKCHPSTSGIILVARNNNALH